MACSFVRRRDPQGKGWCFDLISSAVRDLLFKLDALPETSALSHVLEGILPDEPRYRFPCALGIVHANTNYFEQMRAIEIAMRERFCSPVALHPLWTYPTSQFMGTSWKSGL